jgi:sigma-B regulation protein RsbU (phosphoserine phosphatase)
MQQDRPAILVVDDDPTHVMVLESMLRKEGYDTVSAHDGERAVEAAKTHQPDLILLDIMMPQVDGFQVCRLLQQDSRTTDIPVIFLSALDDVDCKVKAFDIGAVDYVVKPFHKAEVLARVRLQLKLRLSRSAAIQVQTERLRQLHDAQRAILVSPQDLPEARFGVSYSPLQEVGGDFYDVLRISDPIYGYFVADTSGHDLGASFTTPAIKVLLAQYASPLYTAVETVKGLNGVLSTLLSDGHHLTASYARLDRGAGTLEVVSAGHPPVLVVPARGPVEFLEATGDVLGVFGNVCFDPVERAVSAGDRFFLYSDGLIERFQWTHKSRSEGLQQLAEAAVRHRAVPIAEAVNQMYADLLPDESILEDDIVLMGVEV